MKTQSNQSFSIIILFVVLTIIGVCFVPLLNVKFTPSRSLPEIGVNYSWPKASARVLEKEVTSKLEGIFNSMQSVKEVRSKSSAGAGNIQVAFDKDMDLDMARFEMATLIRQVYPELPEGLSYPYLSMKTENEDRQFLKSYTLNSSASPYFIQQFAEEKIVPQLSLVEGVNNIEVYGAVPFIWEVKYESHKLMQLGITSQQVIQGIKNYFNKKELGGVVLSKLEGTYIQIQIESKKNDKFEASLIPLAKVKDRIVYLSDVARLTYKEKEPDSYFRINGLNTINMIVYAEKTANQIDVANRLESQIEKIKSDLPAVYSIIQTYDATNYIKKELEKIAWRTGLSLFILLLFVLIISRQWRYLSIIVASLVVNLSIAAIFYYLLRLEIHLYAMAGITVSLGIILDNSIVMLDHMKHHKNKRVFLAILAATLTTIGSLSVIFFLSDQQKLKLIDFALVMIVNLAVSLFVAILLLPAILDKFPLSHTNNRRSFRRKRRILKIGNYYERLVLFLKRWKFAFILLMFLGFGLPVHLLPEELENEGRFSEMYNKTFGSNWFKDHVKQPMEYVLGGSLRLFAENVFEQSFYAEPEQTKLNIVGKMPEGSTLLQLNDAMMYMENYLSQFEEIQQYQCKIYNPRNGRITITFIDSAEYSSFPYVLKNMVTEKAINFGGMDWAVYGVGRGFSNSLGDGMRNSRITLYGYNYEKLYALANDLQGKILKNPRVKECEVVGSSGWNTRLKYEFNFNADEQLLALNGINYAEIYSYLREVLGASSSTRVMIGGHESKLAFVSDEAESIDLWHLNNAPIQIGEKKLKLSDYAKIEKERVGNDIYKKNQEYQLVVQYDFIGPGKLGNRVMEQYIEDTEEILPLGYSIKKQDYYGWWGAKDKASYWLIALVILIIYFICSILLESFTQPLAIIAMIPISFIGVFLTFFLFELNFDQGGYAAFVLLCGISVNAALYIVNDWNISRKNNTKQILKSYVKAYQHKIIPILLTIVSTVLGLVPFLIAGKNEVFWFSLAAGTIGGLLFSLVGIVMYLPLLLRMNNN
ncbi:efflux RND transporter permease subunit [Marinifilum caeruleilacunae]|uniref:Efflux RND transporter permease subunit n=1 Tax=Marinifilum caeruleilacunae TaxID=2499076 RepID=A0ABX1X1Q7_9BACT|nr:efflux RND transporter permease subunit [Marinifilum caeruleilacunae]NOU62018.1 efflux RND transporter permease subunit [Marinifilum caeruleilacunae]